MTNKNKMLKRLKERAKKKDIPVEITVEDFTVSQFCPILGIPLKVNTGRVGGLSDSPSLDRKNLSLGYTKGNVWVISQLANQMKSNATIDQLRVFARWIIAEYGLDTNPKTV